MASASSTSGAAARITTFTPTITATAGQLYTLSVAAVAPSSSAAAQSILDKGGDPPNKYSASDPLKLFIIQLVIIIALSRGLGYLLRKLRQPAVISEVIGGLILGPSVMGRIPGFTAAIFPPASIPNLTLVANIGLVIFLFLVGLEADFSVFKKNGKAALAISFVGLVVPFGLGGAVSVGIYHKFIDTQTVDFGIFLLFIGTAMAITAFPVLARILTELKLLSNPVGLTVLAAGVGNDVVGWILLALSVALANAGSGVTAVYILLTGVGLCLFLWFLVRPVYHFLVRKSGSYERGPTAGIMTITFMIIFAGAFITDIIGIHPIFGSFLVGLIVVPHGHGFGAALTEKLEDIVTILIIPIYFTLSGLKTDLGLLNNGAIWGWIVAVIIVAFVSKFASCAGTAKLFGYPLRESLAIGSLMSCKGLVELIVLNIGLQAGILNNEVFAMFVVMALVTTFTTTPLTLAFYPESYWKPQMALSGVGSGTDGEKRPTAEGDEGRVPTSKDEEHFRKRFVIVLERLESLPSMMSFVRLLQTYGPTRATAGSSTSIPRTVAESEHSKAPSLDTDGGAGKLDKDSAAPSTVDIPITAVSSPVSVDAYRLLALTERTSALFKASEADVTKKSDSILNIFSAFAKLASIPFTTSMSIVPTEEYVDTVTAHAADTHADLLVVPWTAGTSLSPEDDHHAGNRLESLFGQQAVERSPQYASFVRRVFMESAADVALYLDAGGNSGSAGLSGAGAVGGAKHLYLPFHGGPDDRAALDFLMQLVSNDSTMTATVTRFTRVARDSEDDDSNTLGKAGTADGASSSSPLAAVNQLTIGAGLGAQDTIYAGAHSTQHRLASDTADNIALARYFPSAILETQGQSAESSVAPMLAHTAARVEFRPVNAANPLKATLDALVGLKATHGAVLVLAGRSRRSAPSHRVELEKHLKDRVVTGAGITTLGIAASSDVRKTLGDVGSALVVSGDADSILIIQTAVKGNAFVKGKGKKGV